MTTATKTARKKGLLVVPDDLRLGRFYAVHSLKHAPDEPVLLFLDFFAAGKEILSRIGC